MGSTGDSTYKAIQSSFETRVLKEIIGKGEHCERERRETLGKEERRGKDIRSAATTHKCNTV